MISILRPSTPPLALISSAANWAACGIEAPAIAWASAMTPLLMGSAARAWPEVASRPKAVAPSSVRNDQKTDDWDVFIILFLSSYYWFQATCFGLRAILTGHASPAREYN